MEGEGLRLYILFSVLSLSLEEGLIYRLNISFTVMFACVCRGWGGESWSRGSKLHDYDMRPKLCMSV